MHIDMGKTPHDYGYLWVKIEYPNNWMVNTKLDICVVRVFNSDRHEKMGPLGGENIGEKVWIPLAI